ncbi:hypothetical protein BBH51_05430 [Aggregatibacter actinomycetemcomitans]|uniref:Uncharacterized protein n=1 Tax=Aggregatibacter actinomycetemcomitans TaxID=714 RepID=A0AAC8XYB0_AGGAC|nr:hypothetical protein [Aggregatibacter actinomycetemcomitans]AFI86893.1 hypothetical protein D7S_01109 [Aggregatibacter actinomycetemcomitans D7S-1]AMQ94021.1 hypothetical protein ACT75_05515 [Aggregatibacter actinomycetemcomitans]ANU82135.1 hypothetical protein BBH51_05430 [Aggregatibacter actinomycetemcomitans]EKX98969.1 hypothetical protein HMPREF9996_00087 [Aggregatibacter actinomycetemcomitans Y4]KND85725.1 hypothetical protein H5P1_0202625 [Aggregatibacter actinomycetemcomitans serotyp
MSKTFCKPTALLPLPLQQAIKIAFNALILNNTIFFKLAQGVSFSDFSGNFASILQHGTVGHI